MLQNTTRENVLRKSEGAMMDRKIPRTLNGKVLPFWVVPASIWRRDGTLS